jgi:hypothetical protein
MKKTIPDLNTLCWPLWFSLILGLLAVLLQLPRITHPIISNDLWWHIALGKYVFESGNPILDHSVFTWTPATAFNTYNAWLGEVFFYLIDKIAGVKGLIAVRFGIYFLVFMLGWGFALKRGIARHPLTWVIVLVSLALVVPSFSVKPSLLTLGLTTITVWLYFYIRSVGEPAKYLFYLFPLILMIWVNVHGGFFITAPFFLLIAIGEILNRKFSPQFSMQGSLQKHLFIALFLCGVAIFITPYGYKMPLDIITALQAHLIQDADFTRRIVAYTPTSFLNAPPNYLLDYMLLAMLLFVLLIWQQLKNRNVDWVVILVFITYCALFTKMARVTYFLGPVFLFVGLDLLAYKKDSWVWSNSIVKKSILIAVCIIIFALIGWRTVAANSCIRIQDKITQMLDISTYSISVEAEYIAKNLPGERVGNLYKDGGYLIYRLWPEKQVMIDPRYFPFEKWINDYFDQFVNAKDIAKFIKKYPADFWLIRYQKQLVFQWFYKSTEWDLLYLGPHAGIFVPKAAVKVETILSPDIAEMHNIKAITNAVISNLNVNNLDVVHLLQQAAQNNLNKSCPKHKAFISEITSTLDGFEAFNAGNYKLAAEKLSQRKAYFRTSGKAASAYMKLSEKAFDSKDYYNARFLMKEALAHLSAKQIIDIYNMAITDWHYRHFDNSISPKIDDGLSWEQLVQLIIDKKHLISEDNTEILETANALREGSYNGNGRLIPRYVE